MAKQMNIGSSSSSVDLNVVNGKLQKGGTNVSLEGHTHNYAGSASAGGAANSVANTMTIQFNSGTTEGTNKFTFNGSTAKSINVTPSIIGLGNVNNTSDLNKPISTTMQAALDGKSDTSHTHTTIHNGEFSVKLGYDSDGGYFRPNLGESSLGSSSNQWSNTYTKKLNVTGAKPIFSYIGSNGGGSTVSYATNMFVGNTGIVSRTTNTSSRTIKHDITELTNEAIKAENLYNVNVYQAKYNTDILSQEDPRYLKDLPMFIIEDLDEKYPMAVDKPSDNVQEWSWNAQYLIPPMLKLIQDQKKEIDDLKLRLEILES